MILVLSSVLFDTFSGTLILADTQSKDSVSSVADDPEVGMSGSQTVESSCAIIWYFFSRPGMESGRVHCSVTLLDVTSEMTRNRGAAGTIEKRKSFHKQ